MAEITDEDLKIAFTAGVSTACIEMVLKVESIALDEYKTDPRYLDDFHISLRDIKQITKRIQGVNGEHKTEKESIKKENEKGME